MSGGQNTATAMANIISTYNRGLGQRKLSSQQRTTTSTTKNNNASNMKAVQKNSWIGGGGNSNTMNTTGGGVAQSQNPHTYSNIINNNQIKNYIIDNNIQGLSINYSNQIIQNGMIPTSADSLPIQQFANTLILGQNFIRNNEFVERLNNASSSDSLLNSHRRCKSQSKDNTYK